jgi:hypothetical protein
MKAATGFNLPLRVSIVNAKAWFFNQNRKGKQVLARKLARNRPV